MAKPNRNPQATLRVHAGATGPVHVRGGYTLMELMVAMALCTAAMTLVFYSWNYISRHTIVQQRKTMFQVDADRLAQSIAGELRRSPEVITLDRDKTVFVTPNGADTVTYSFSGGTLLRNTVPVSFVAPGVRVTQFSLEKEASLTANPACKAALVTLTLGMEDSFGNSRLIPLKVRIVFQEHPEENPTHKWNF